MNRCSETALYSNLLADLAHVARLEDILADDVHPFASYREFACHALAHSFYKKYVGRKASNADKLAHDKFLSVNSDCLNYSLEMSSTWDEVLVGTLKDELYRFFYPSGMPLLNSIEQFVDAGRAGPGTSISAKGTDFYTKMFDSKLSATSTDLYFAYKERVSLNPEWALAERFRWEHNGGCDRVEGSKLSFVPKTHDISRLICIEPSVNMFIQLGLGKILEGRLKSAFGIDLAVQPELNRNLARVGSLNDSYVTIDLSSASDSMSLRMLREFLPRHVLPWFEKTRSPRAWSPLLCEFVELGMVSSMGNGFTFPLQTAFFTCIVSAAARCRQHRLKRAKFDVLGSLAENYAVFGDDIIVDKAISGDVLRLLALCGFTVNADKTFVEGPFRESCGHDYYHGRNVRGVYVKSLRSVQDRVAIINNLNLWSATTGVSLSNTIKYLLSTVRGPRGSMPFVPFAESEDAGVRVPFELLGVKPKRDVNTGAVKYRRFTSTPKRLTIGESEVLVSAKEKYRRYNPSGLLIAMLHGSLRNCTITIRHDRCRYRAGWALTPYWDYVPVQGLFGSSSKELEDFWLRWKSAVGANLCLK